MTTTTVTVYQSTYDVGIRHVYFDGHGSTSTVGSFWSDGWLEWHVFYPGSTTADESHQGTPCFSYLCTLPGAYTFKYRATDRGGNHGSWVEQTVTVANESTADYVQYVDPLGGDDLQGGTSDVTAVADLHVAETNIKANWVTDGTHIIYVKRGAGNAQNYPPWSGHTARGRVIFRPYGAGPGRAVVENTFGSIICGTGQTSIVFWDVDLDMGTNEGFDLDYGITRTVPYDFILKDCLITQTTSGFQRNIVGADAGARSGTDRANNVFGFVAAEGVTVRAPDALFAWFGFSYASLLHFVDVWVDGLYTSGTSHSLRLWNVRNFYARDCLWDAQAPTGSNLRFPTREGAGAADATERITSINCRIISGTAYSHEAGNNEVNYVRDVTWVNCQGMFSPQRNLSGWTGSSYDADRIVNRNCYVGIVEYEWTPGTNGVVGDFLIENCLIPRGYGGYAIWVLSTTAAQHTGTIKFRNNIGYWDQSGNPAPQVYYKATGLTDAQLDAIIDSDRNVAVSVDADAITWTSTSSGDSSLATWRTTSGQDANSDDELSTTLPITVGPVTDPDWDPHLTSTTGYLPDKGLDDAYTFDMDGKLRIGDYPGPDDPEATTSPDVPTLGSGSAPVRSTFQNLDRGSCATRTASLGGLLL